MISSGDESKAIFCLGNSLFNVRAILKGGGSLPFATCDPDHSLWIGQEMIIFKKIDDEFWVSCLSIVLAF